jgi:hypothetical protein
MQEQLLLLATAVQHPKRFENAGDKRFQWGKKSERHHVCTAAFRPVKPIMHSGFS